MLDRIRQLIQARQLSSTQFADAIGVARPIVSHILSGRNKPSLEVVQKILAAFPDLSMAWLLNGQGAMLSSKPMSPPQVSVKPIAASSATAPPKRGVKAATEPEKPAESYKAPSIALPASSEAPDAIADATPTAPPDLPLGAGSPPPGPNNSAGTISSRAIPEVVAQPAVTQPKTIRRVLIFYSDGTFTDYTPATEPA
ncbi:helix-turn-helix domain-containing protein [Hymenobacter latericus]|uniref:helix-turn-helix domain-containing protein n=1 Tax=Hymenobacter sp. YIM 151858-1 TaxID=2987688 RepID=UPI0022261892|nr:helix-turn-helix domain-containing protein [Hymenobacter sp. YIM 151858-1]UYZ59937.1 helix-turn-helix domain-containing protein [Hymenobacter sp. YIM 151858-1]